MIPGSVAPRSYPVRMPPVSAHDVAAELRRQLPGLPIKKLHKLLYYCQGHHLAHTDRPLFAEPVMAWDMGPVVARVWKAEKEQSPRPDAKPLDNGQLNTVSYVVSRYGRLTGNDLELLTHAESPWRQANSGRTEGGNAQISTDSIKRFFAAEGGPDLDLPWPLAETLVHLSSGANARRLEPASEDDVMVLRGRLSPQ